MRIIIEANENENIDIVQPVQGEAKPAPMGALDGGPPPEMLVQAITGAPPVPPERVTVAGGINAGPPPEWLLVAIQGSPSPER